MEGLALGVELVAMEEHRHPQILNERTSIGLWGVFLLLVLVSKQNELQMILNQTHEIISVLLAYN